MKKTLFALFAVASAAVFAGKDDLLVTFSTPGTDTYADGKTVLAGEAYALVYTKADGSQETVLTYKTKEAGRCTPVLFVVDENDKAKYSGGEWGVYLLDTRDYEKDPTGATLGRDDKGNITVVNVKAKATDATIRNSMDSASASVAVSGDSFEIPNPTVTGIKVEGAYVYVTVRDVVPCLEYTLKSSSDTQNFVIPEGVEKDASSTVKEITLAVPKKEGAQFFKVTTK